MTQRLRTRRPDKEIYVPRHKRGGNEDIPLHVNIIANDENEGVTVERETLNNTESKRKCNKKENMNCGNVNEEVLSKTLKSKEITNDEIKLTQIKKEDKCVNVIKNIEDKFIKEVDNVTTESPQFSEGEVHPSTNQSKNELQKDDSIDNTDIPCDDSLYSEKDDSIDNTDIPCDDSLYSAACCVSDDISELIFLDVYLCLGNTKQIHKAISKYSDKLSHLLLQDGYKSSIKGIMESKQRQKNTGIFSEDLSHKTIKQVYKSVTKRYLHVEQPPPEMINVEYPPPQILNNQLYMQLMLPEIVTNIINTAIENALEILKASMKAENKPCKSLYIFQSNNACTFGNGNRNVRHIFPSDKDTRTFNESNTNTCADSEIEKTLPNSSALLTEEDYLNNKLENLEIEDNNVLPNDECSLKEISSDVNSCNSALADDKNSISSANQIENNLINKDNLLETSEKSAGLKKKKKKVKPEGSPVPKAVKKKRKKKETTKDQDKTTCEQNDTLNDILLDSDVRGDFDDWDMNYTEDGECLKKEVFEPSVLGKQESSNTENGEVINYLEFKPKDIVLDIGEFGHVLELYDFSPQLKSSDLYNSMKAAGVADYTLHWVDDAHALAVFASQVAAHNAMKIYTPLVQMRQVVNGTRESRIKIKDLKDVMLPYKKRPQTTSMVARNLVAGSLGIRTNATKEQRDKEKEILRKAREEKRLKEKQKRDIWEKPDG